MRAVSLKRLLAGLAGLTVVAVAAPASAAVSFTCTPEHIGSVEEGTTTNRVEVRCVTPATDATSSIFYFAVPAAYTAYANRFVSLAATALSTGRTLVFGFNPGQNRDLSNNDFGCSVTNCRYPVFILLR
jgi:hypothetical protein